jgi:hypothetical protein
MGYDAICGGMFLIVILATLAYDAYEKKLERDIEIERIRAGKCNHE